MWPLAMPAPVLGTKLQSIRACARLSNQAADVRAGHEKRPGVRATSPLAGCATAEALLLPRSTRARRGNQAAGCSRATTRSLGQPPIRQLRPRALAPPAVGLLIDAEPDVLRLQHLLEALR
eukprot:CAMPEP_0170428378 /NCGR_PEP_ID=MMETSP0117_2-20130122/39738_1 /TAXON_ID=400756 /ORGANISM="Durinskia baltica, Strain CSIRO CS-38" /LENGTH=120 /DNA_ID=CAMNT_0010687667 /DNA_START=105 /DNA_END=467 /DNA_ORIENTATION=-